jgi:hypothetical protein
VFSCASLNVNLLAAGDALLDVQGEIERGLSVAEQAGFGFSVDRIRMQLGLVRTLRGLTPTFGRLDDPHFDERQMEERFAHSPDLAFPEGAIFQFIVPGPTEVDASCRQHGSRS